MTLEKNAQRVPSNVDPELSSDAFFRLRVCQIILDQPLDYDFALRGGEHVQFTLADGFASRTEQIDFARAAHAVQVFD